MTTIGIIRHGSTLWNKEGRAQGNTDVPLDHDGLSEAYKLGERLRKENWDAIVSSDLLRARQTAEIVSEKINSPIHFDSRLREVGGGLIEGTTNKERVVKWGENWEELDLGIEKTEQVVKRGLLVIEDVTQEYQGQRILLISHGSFISHLIKELVPTSCLEDAIKNTSLTILQMTAENTWEKKLYNCTRHLGNT